MPIARGFNTVALVSLTLLVCGCAGSGTAMRQDASTASARQDDPSCLKDTGSRIAPAPGSANCAGFGRAYSNDDINRTGSTTAAGSLRLLDPSLTVHY
jgi:hypothetical protein